MPIPLLRKCVLCWWYQQCRKVQQSSALAKQNAALDFKACHSDGWEKVLMLLTFVRSLIVHRFKHLSRVLSVNCSFMSPDCSFIRVLFIFLSLLKTCLHIKLLVLYCWYTLGTFLPLGSWPLVFSLFPCDIYLLGVLLVLFFNFFCLLVGWIFDFCLFGGRSWLFWWDFCCWWWWWLVGLLWTYQNFIFRKPNLCLI